ncbi:MAG TPA: glutamate--tRNA ligase family protein [Phycisphaerales bacterium]|nr:glutamate--tRNA ligase family protein [Phycisphaerales bacterium]
MSVPTPNRHHTTRLAPSPTGALHLGNARTFLITWAMARSLGWRIILRIEDMDTPRIKADAASGLIETLRWLGLDWDPPEVGPPDNPLVQSADLDPYRAALRTLAAKGHAYPCDLTRTQIEAAASAPQEGAHETPFPAALRPATAGQSYDFDASPKQANWRLLCPAGEVRFTDGFSGPKAFDPSRIVGDFVLWTKRDQPSYQLAVVVDDERQGVDQIIRGDDLLDSTARQMLLRRALGHQNEPAHWHLPLVIGTDGRRLAKRHGDTRIDTYRQAGVPAEAVVGLMAAWSIPGAARSPMNAREFMDRFDPATMPRGEVTFTSEDDAWLRSQARR